MFSMAETDTQKKAIPYKTVEEGGQKLLVIDYSSELRTPSISESPIVMRDVIVRLLELRKVDKIVLIQRQEFVYDVDQTRMLLEIADLYNDFIKKGKLLDLKASSRGVLVHELTEKYDNLQRIIMHLLISDPIAAFVEIKRMLRAEELALEDKAGKSSVPKANRMKLIEDLQGIVKKLESLTLIMLCKDAIAGYDLGDRKIYDTVLAPTVKPYFIYTKIVTKYPTGAKALDSYSVGDAKVTIFQLSDEVRPLYFVVPPEFTLSESKYDLLEKAREVIAKHQPTRDEYISPNRTRETFSEIEKDLLADLAKSDKVDLSAKELENLTKMLIRYTIGFGMIEVILSDPKIQDLVVNSPVGGSPIFVVHQDYGECKTNITATQRDADGWATKLRMMSGRPLDEANPVLDTSLVLPDARARVAVVQEPLSANGISFAFRRHRSTPWTLPLFIQNGMITPLAGGLLSFLADGGRTMLVAGTRSSGKTSLLGAILLEIIRKYRIITIEDTMELGTDYMRDLGYNIQSLQVRSAIAGSEQEISAAEGIRTSLRMGDSCLIVGEVRSTEALALYEAMRIGALAHLVAGTIHGDSPYSVFDRVVNDLKVPVTSFKATDILVVANPVKTASGISSKKRVVQISEVRKFWNKDPLEENGFSDLLLYDSAVDRLTPSSTLVEGESEILKAVAATVKEWVGDWPAAWKNILLRSKIKAETVKLAEKLKRQDILEAPMVVRSNDEFHRISEEVYNEIGTTDPKLVFEKWQNWIKKEIR